MGFRLSKIVTKQGDDGTTSLDGVHRIDKDDIRIHALGDVDELNSFIGLLAVEVTELELTRVLQSIQQHLFDVGGELALPDYPILQEEVVVSLDEYCMLYNNRLPPLKEFILPRGTRATCLAHCCRTIARRAERHLVALSKQQTVRGVLLMYLNRLSDLLFILARYFNECPEMYWASEKLERTNDAESV